MPTDEQRALWAAIRANPDDDTPRLVYADWLQERGDEQRAEFIRVQIELHQIGRDRRKGRKRRPIIEPREKELLAAHRYDWGAEFKRVMDADQTGPNVQRIPLGSLNYRRGFLLVPYLSVHHAARLAVAAALEPVELVNVSDYVGNAEQNLQTLAQWPGATSLSTLSLYRCGDDTARALAASESLRRLVYLSLVDGSVSDDGVRALAGWPLAASLRGLTLSGNPITNAGATALAESPHLGGLNALVLWRTQIAEDGRRILHERFGSHTSFGYPN